MLSNQGRGSLVQSSARRGTKLWSRESSASYKSEACLVFFATKAIS
jgi:hypothetical protein